MKKMMMLLAALLAASGVIKAQDTIRYPDSCYMYNPYGIDSVLGNGVGQRPSTMGYDVTMQSWVVAPNMPPDIPEGWIRVLDPLTDHYYWIYPGKKRTYGRYREYIASEQTLIYGIAATTGDDGYWFNSGRRLDSIYTLGELHNISYITDSNFNLYAYLFRKTKGEIYCVDSVKWIRHNNPYRFFEYQRYLPPGFESYDYSPVVTYSYEFYFDHPVSVFDTFLIGVRFPYIDSLALLYSYWWEVYGMSVYPMGEYQNYILSDTPLDKVNFCTDHVSYSSNAWGAFFPILTPQDTTRCYPVREVSMFTATDTSITLTWRADNATQWEVEYAEADGMTVYTVTTTTPRVTLTGLRPTTTYLAHVRAWCTRDSEYGEWSPFVEAQTTAHQPDDTTQGPDTVKIDAVGLFTRLMPNPARGLVTVQSAYSLNHVALYDMQGRLMLEQKAAGNAATFDVGVLPKGVYMVSVRTVAGTTTKRLLVE